MSCLLETERSSRKIFSGHITSIWKLNCSLGLDWGVASRTFRKIFQLAPVQFEPSHFPVLKKINKQEYKAEKQLSGIRTLVVTLTSLKTKQNKGKECLHNIFQFQLMPISLSTEHKTQLYTRWLLLNEQWLIHL